MNVLHVFDVSAMVYAGNYTGTEWFGYPVGGIQYVLNRIALAVASYDWVVPCFDSPSFRNEIYSKYKSGREKHPEVYSQIETLYEGLQHCGIKCEKYDRYEADDLIEWAVAENFEKFVRGVEIVGNDRDLCHSIRNNVVFRTTNSTMTDVDQNNFSTAIKKGIKVPYNTVSAYKVFCGCSSDAIPAMKLKKGVSGYTLYQLWCKACGGPANLRQRIIGANPETVRVFCQKIGIFTEEELKGVDKRIELIYPAEKPEDVTLEPTKCSEVDKDALAKFMNLYGAKTAVRCIGKRVESLTDNDKMLLKNKAQVLKTGAYAADKNLESRAKSVRSKCVDLDAFTRGF